ncbi:hypothetical protein [Parvibaculum sp.]|uniref:hypothetical protein n=1 Tax=Parvibaculum sp. TaxID=2024848 RepID=UPI00320CF1EC
MPLIACLGWGSLIWDPQDLPIQRHWFEDGPFAKVEFARQSQNDRITLVIEETAAQVRTLWAVMIGTDVEYAKKALRQREGCKSEHIGSWAPGTPSPATIPNLAEWAAAHEIDHVIWTALPPKFDGTDGKTPSIEEVLSHLRKLEGPKRDNAEKYIRLAPRQVDTAYRRKIEAELGWTASDQIDI